MKLLKNYPFWVSCYVTAVGLGFGVLTMVRTPPLEFKESNPYVLMGISLIFFILGVRYGYLALRGKLEPKGITVKDVRKEALRKIKSEAYLAKVIKEDPDPGVRKTALKRLEEITSEDGN